jgi:Fe-S-cluster containining protein
MDGLYYVHRKPCPAYDEASGSCTIYGQDLKPEGCTDFPVYEDEGDIIADLRCEAVDLGALTKELAHAIGPEFRIVKSADEEFPFLVTLSLKRATGAGSERRKGKPGKKSGRL